MKQGLGKQRTGWAGAPTRTTGEPVVAVRTASGTTLRLVRPLIGPKNKRRNKSGSLVHPLAFAPRQSEPVRRQDGQRVGGMPPA